MSPKIKTQASPNIISKQTGISVSVLLMLILPLITACVFVVTANDKIAALEKDLAELKIVVKEHSDYVIPELEKLKYNVSTKMLDRWTKSDDNYYMERFANYNNLKTIEHKRLVPTRTINRDN